MASKKKTTAAAKKTTATTKRVKRSGEAHPGCHAHHGREAECPRTGEKGIQCARIGPDGNACNAVSQVGAAFCFHCKQPFPVTPE